MVHEVKAEAVGFQAATGRLSKIFEDVRSYSFISFRFHFIAITVSKVDGLIEESSLQPIVEIRRHEALADACADKILKLLLEYS